MISITVDIAYRNPRTYPICSAILSKLLSFIHNNNEKKQIIEKIMKKFAQIPNTGYMEVWLQRISRSFAPDIDFKESLCKLVCNQDVSIWNNEWISCKELKKALNAKIIFDKNKADSIDPIIPSKEIELYMSNIGDYM